MTCDLILQRFDPTKSPNFQENYDFCWESILNQLKLCEQQVKVSENKKQPTINPKHTILSWQRMKKIVISLFLRSPTILLSEYEF